MSKLIISISGFQSSGKDTIADYLQNKYGFYKYSFANKLKMIISIIFGWDKKKLEGIEKVDREWRETVDEWWSKKLNISNFTPRYAMLNIGTIFRDYFNKDIWVNSLEKEIDNSDKNKIVISDCRFENEYNLIESYNGYKICVIRDLEKYNYYCKIDNFSKTDIHESEYRWINFKYDYVIFNDGNIEKLYNNIDIILKEILKI